MTNPLDYVPTPIPENGIMKFSPSQFSKFIQAPHNWYRSEVLGEDGFSHNTSSVLGTVVHYCAEMVAKGEEVNKKVIEEYIIGKLVHDDYVPGIVMGQYTEMAERLVNDYVLENEFFEVETQHIAHLKDGYYAAGTLDALHGDKNDCLIVDYKTYSSKTKPKVIPAYYKYQLLVYAFILIQNGYNPTRIRLVYVNRNIEGEISEKTQKRMKSYPPEVTILTENVTDEDIEFIGGLLELAVDTCEASKKHPELTHVIWHDPRLKVA
jgi:hypothetical protein